MRVLLAALLFLLSGCSQQQWNEKLSTPQDRALAAKTIADLRSGNTAGLRQEMADELFAHTPAEWDKVKAMVPSQGNPELVTVQSNTMSVDGTTTSTKILNYEFGAASKWVIFQIQLRQNGPRTQVVGWYVQPFAVQPSAAGEFSFADKGALHYLWIVAMLVSVLTILTALILIVRSRGIRRRWLWILGSLVGLGQFSLNWSTGAWGIQPIYFSLFGAAAMKASPFDAWVLSFSLPVVAIVFLLRRKSLIANGTEPDPAVELS